MRRMTNTAATPMTTRMIAGSLATVVTLVCAGMAGISAMQRAPNLINAVMLVTLALVMVVGSHLLPALARKSWMARAVFVVCVGVTLYNHAYFFDANKREQGQQRQAEVTPSEDVARIQHDLTLISVRPLSAVASDIASARTSAARAEAALERCATQDTLRCSSLKANLEIARAKIDALQDERAQSLRADGLREQLAIAMADHKNLVQRAGVNTVDSNIAHIVGIEVETVATITSVMQSIALEVMGAILWAVALPRPHNPERKSIERKPKVQEVRIKHIVPYNPMPKAPRLIGWAKKALVQHQAQPRDSPVVLRPA